MHFKTFFYTFKLKQMKKQQTDYEKESLTQEQATIFLIVVTILGLIANIIFR